MSQRHFSSKIREAAATDGSYAKLVEFIESHKNEVEFVGILNRDRLFADKNTKFRPYDSAPYKKSFDIVYNKQCGYVNGIHQEELRKLFFDEAMLLSHSYKHILHLDSMHQVQLVIIITNNNLHAEDLPSHGIISFDDIYTGNAKVFDCMISNIDDYSQIPVNPVKDINKKISRMKHQSFKNKVKEAMPEIIMYIIAAIIGCVIMGLLTWGFYFIGSKLFSLDMTTFNLLGISIPRGPFNLTTGSFGLTCAIVAIVAFITTYIAGSRM